MSSVFVLSRVICDSFIRGPFYQGNITRGFIFNGGQHQPVGVIQPKQHGLVPFGQQKSDFCEF